MTTTFVVETVYTDEDHTDSTPPLRRDSDEDTPELIMQTMQLVAPGTMVQTRYGKGRVMPSYKNDLVTVMLTSWHLSNGSAVTCFLNPSTEDIKSIPSPMLSAMNVHEVLVYVQEKKQQGSMLLHQNKQEHASEKDKELNCSMALDYFDQALSAIQEHPANLLEHAYSYETHTQFSSTEQNAAYRAKFLLLAIECSNQAASCAWRLQNLPRVFQSTTNALRLLKALEERKAHAASKKKKKKKKGKELVSPGELRVFGVLRTKSLLLTAQGLLLVNILQPKEAMYDSQQRKQATLDVIDRGQKVIAKYTQLARNSVKGTKKSSQLYIDFRHHVAKLQSYQHRFQRLTELVNGGQEFGMEELSLASTSAEQPRSVHSDATTSSTLVTSNTLQEEVEEGASALPVMKNKGGGPPTSPSDFSQDSTALTSVSTAEESATGDGAAVAAGVAAGAVAAGAVVAASSDKDEEKDEKKQEQGLFSRAYTAVAGIFGASSADDDEVDNSPAIDERAYKYPELVNYHKEEINKKAEKAAVSPQRAARSAAPEEAAVAPEAAAAESGGLSGGAIAGITAAAVGAAAAVTGAVVSAVSSSDEKEEEEQAPESVSRGSVPEPATTAGAASVAPSTPEAAAAAPKAAPTPPAAESGGLSGGAIAAITGAAVGAAAVVTGAVVSAVSSKDKEEEKEEVTAASVAPTDSAAVASPGEDNSLAVAFAVGAGVAGTAAAAAAVSKAKKDPLVDGEEDEDAWRENIRVVAPDQARQRTVSFNQQVVVVDEEDHKSASDLVTTAHGPLSRKHKNDLAGGDSKMSEDGKDIFVERGVNFRDQVVVVDGEDQVTAALVTSAHGPLQRKHTNNFAGDDGKMLDDGKDLFVAGSGVAFSKQVVVVDEEDQQSEAVLVTAKNAPLRRKHASDLSGGDGMSDDGKDLFVPGGVAFDHKVVIVDGEDRESAAPLVTTTHGPLKRKHKEELDGGDDNMSEDGKDMFVAVNGTIPAEDMFGDELTDSREGNIVKWYAKPQVVTAAAAGAVVAVGAVAMYATSGVSYSASSGAGLSSSAPVYRLRRLPTGQR